MTRPVLLPIVLLLAATVAGTSARSRQEGDLARARQLYAEASYEEALALLPAAPAEADADEVDRYKALCLIALGRTTDAEQAFERVITRDPDFQITSEESPRVVELFRDVRRRILPLRAESLYARAKADYQDQHYADAIEKFTAAIDIMGDPDVGSALRMQELRAVAEEYRELAEERLPEEPVGTLDAAAEPAQGNTDPEAVYTMLSRQVKPPVEVARRMPTWNPPADQAWRTFRGVIEVVVSRRGQVEDVRLLERLAPFYDNALVEAAWGWRFEPARLNGLPVRFRHRIDLVIRPQ
jgi:tetratricopeptide (TPR) repeat protein